MQLEFIHREIETVNNKTSTIAFELLNEPQVFRHSDFRKVSKYHDYLLRRVTDLTDKAMIYCYSYAGRLGAFNFPWVQAKIRPSLSVSNKIIFDIHPYPPYHIVMLYFKLILKLMKVDTVLAGEYNSGTGDGIDITLSKHESYLKTFKKFSPYGVIFWQWSCLKDIEHPASNLATTVEGKITPNDNFDNFIKSKSSL